VVASDGEAEGPPVVARAVVGDTPPPGPSVMVRPERPVAGESLTCQASTALHDVGSEVVEVRFRWLRDGVPQPLGDGQAALPAQVIRRGERWRCEAWASDGTAESARVQAEVLVQDSPPGQPEVVVEPARPRTTDALTCRVARPAADPDGDEVSYAFAWWRNDAPLGGLADPAVVPARTGVRGDRFRCAATPSDGQQKGPPGSAEQVLVDSPPGPARARLRPEAPAAGRPLRCEVAAPSSDPDGDAVRYRYRWERNGAAQPIPEASQEVPGPLVRAGDRWRCLVVPNDGELDGPAAASEEVDVGKAQ
jgi:hypothetical protein